MSDFSHDDRATPPPPPPPAEVGGDVRRPPPLPGPSDADSPDERRQEFLNRARYIIAEQRGFNPKCEAMLDSAARDLGLDSDQAAQALETLRRPPPRADEAATAPGGVPPASQEPPAPPKQEDSPQTKFRAYVFEALAASSRDVVRESKEQRLVEEGVRKLRLSSVLARQIVHQVALDIGKGVVSQQKTASVVSATNDLDRHPQQDKFLLRAKAILAEQRGINARSRMLLAAAAREMNLTEEQADQAIASLQGSSQSVSNEEAWRQERIESFRIALGDEVARLTHGVATSRMQQGWITDAGQRHGVDAPEAEKVIREVLAKKQVRVVSEDQAREYMASLVAQLLGEAVVLEDDVRVQVFAEGSQWGLSPMQVDAIVRERIRQNRRQSSVTSRLVLFALTAGVGIVCTLVSVLAWVLLTDEPPSIPLSPSSPAVAPPQPSVVPNADPVEPGWWSQDENVLIAMTKSRRVMAEQKLVLDRICQSDADERSLGYRQLVAAAAESTDDAVREGLFQELTVACYAGDPSDECAEVIRESLRSLFPVMGDDLPAEESGFDSAFCAMRTIVSVLVSPASAPQRVDELVRAVSSRLGTPIDAALEGPALERQCAGALYRHLLAVVIAGASKDPLVAAPLFTMLERPAKRCLPETVLSKLRVDFLFAALPAAGEDWRDYEPVLIETIASPDPLTVLRMVELMEQSSSESLQTYLAENLQARVGNFPTARSVKEAASRVREAFGAKQVVTGLARWQQLDERSQKREGQPAEGDDEAQTVLQQSVDYAQLATRACALAQGEVGYATFDELEQQNPIKLASGAASGVNRNRRRTPDRPTAEMQRQNVLRYIHYLTDPRRRAAHRPVYLRGLASFAPSVDEIDRDSAEKLAGYMMKPKSEEEHQAVVANVEAVGRWRNVLLALADEVLETQLQRDRIQPMIEVVLASRFQLDGEEAWKERLYEELLRRVMDELGVDAAREAGEEKIYDHARDAIREMYAVQARLLGVAPQEYTSAETPAQLLRLMISTSAGKLAGSGDSSRLFLERLPYELEAMEFVNDDDVQRTAALQRVWLRTLSLLVAHKQPSRAAAAEQVLAKLKHADADAANVLVQLRDGEQALLDMWLLLRE